MSARMIYVELPAPDVQAAVAFYSAVFGWTFVASSLSDQEYWTFSSEDAGLGGALDPSKTPSADGPVIYVQVADLAGTLAKVEAAGGETVSPAAPVGGDYGHSAVFADPNGTRLGLWSQQA